MAFKLTKLSATDYEAGERLYLTKDRTEVVGEGDPKAAFLLAGKGQTISAKQAEQFGLVKSKPEAKSDDAGERQTRVERPRTR